LPYNELGGHRWTEVLANFAASGVAHSNDHTKGSEQVS